MQRTIRTAWAFSFSNFARQWEISTKGGHVRMVISPRNRECMYCQGCWDWFPTAVEWYLVIGCGSKKVYCEWLKFVVLDTEDPWMKPPIAWVGHNVGSASRPGCYGFLGDAQHGLLSLSPTYYLHCQVQEVNRVSAPHPIDEGNGCQIVQPN